MTTSLLPEPSDAFVRTCELRPFPGEDHSASSTSRTLGGSVSDPKFWLYRERTIALLRRYLRISIEVGRLPSLLGRELFRSKVTSYRMSSFEDAVIFVHDVERALDQLDTFAKDLVATGGKPKVFSSSGCKQAE